MAKVVVLGVPGRRKLVVSLGADLGMRKTFLVSRAMPTDEDSVRMN